MKEVVAVKLKNPVVSDASDLVELLQQRAQERPDALASRFLLDGEQQAESLTFGELDRRARAIAARLVSLGPGDRHVVLLYPPGLDYVAGLFGCLYAGVAAVPAYPPDPLRPERTLPRLESLLRDCRPSAVLTIASLLAPLRENLGPVLDGTDAVWLSTDDLEVAAADGFAPVAPGAGSLALIQYTSGATAAPKGVLLSHGNLMAGLRQLYLRFELWHDSGCVTWLPPYHDMGLIGGILLSIYAGYPHTWMAPWSFLERPVRWLEAFSRTGPTITGAPNFAFDLVVRKTTPEERAALDLSCFRKVVCGAERIRPDTVRRFLDAFAVSGVRPEAFTPAYGLAEATLLVAAAECGTLPTTDADTVSCGPPVDGAEIAIVDPTRRREVPDGDEGEIWVASPTVGAGYLGRPEESEAVFRARLADAPARGPFLRTGDLGAMREGGLVVSGRMKDLIIVRGRNIAPEDVEAIAQSAHPALRPGCATAFSVEVAAEERLVVVLEVRAGYDDDLDPVGEAVRRAVAAGLQVQPHAVSLIEAGTLPKTSSGKLQRARCREGYEAGELKVLAEWRETIRPAESDRVVESPRPRAERSAPNPPRRRASVPHDAAEPIAVVGIGCRFPGASGPRALWELLHAGIDPIREVPRERFDIDAYYDPDPNVPRSITSRYGGFVDGVEGFEPLFFGLTPREVDTMDPQQRMLLEVTWEALEDAGWPPSALAGTRTGVFIGVGGTDYAHLLEQHRDPSSIDAYMGTGNAHSIAANRISYLYDLRGPSLALDTACSSSSVAVHLACQSLRLGESDAAFAGGVNLILVPEISIAFSRARMLAPDGRCKTFDADANGYVRSEGCGLVVLKRLSDAVRDGDEIWGLVLGSAVNQDGRTSGMTVPSRTAQREVFEDALARAGVGPQQVGYIEAHGTGTAIGDPTEVEALRDVLTDGVAREEERNGEPCYLGSIKASIGHTECAAGVAGLIKTLLCLHYECIPGQLHLRELNPRIQLDGSPLEIVTEPRAWPRRREPRVAAVSSFGFGGTNCQLIVGDAPAPQAVTTRERPLHVLTLSGRTGEALAEGAASLASHLLAQPDLEVADVGYTLNTGRDHLAHRAAVVVSTTKEARSRLDALAAGERPRGVSVGEVAEREVPRIAFVFTGQGSQYPDMGRGLYETEPTFRAALERCAAFADPHLDIPLLSVMFPGDADDERRALIHRTEYTQPALFALEVALFELWKNWGIHPDAVMGHSLGEYAAAWAAGCLDLEQTLELLVRRGALMESAPPGRMIAASADEGRVRAEIGGMSDQIAVAAINTPESTVVSGSVDAIGKLLTAFEAVGIRTAPLNATRGIHSPAIEPILDDLQRAAERLDARPPDRPLVSNLTGGFVTEAPDGVYWRRHAREPVRFLDGVRALFEGGVDIVVEIGPSPVLLAMGRRCVARGTGEWLPSLRRAGDDWPAIAAALAKLYTLGARIDWNGFGTGVATRKLRLPVTRFQHERYYPLVEEGEARAASPLVARVVDSALDTRIFEADLGVGALGYLTDHRIQGSAVFPMTGFLGMAIAAARHELEDGPVRLDDVAIQQALFLPKGEARTAQILISPASGGAAAFEVASRRTARAGDGAARNAGWTRHASGTIRTVTPEASAKPPRVDLAALRERCHEEVSAEDLYAELDRRGLQYGAAFRGVERLWRSDGEALGEVVRTTGDGRARSPDPALLDACLQLLAAAMPAEDLAAAGGQTWLPVGLERLELYAELPARVVSHCRWESGESDGTLTASVRILDPSGEVLAEIAGLRWVVFGGASADDALHPERLRSDWVPAPVPDPEDENPGHWIVLADRGGVGLELARVLTERGYSCTVATLDEVAAGVANGSSRIAAFIERAAAGASAQTLLGVAHLWSLDASLPEDGGTVDLRAAVDLGAGSLLELVGALDGVSRSPTPRLVAVTRGAQAAGAGDRVAEPLQAPVWGLAQVITMEHPSLRCLRLDLDPSATGGTPAEAGVQIADELTALGYEDQVALRGGERRVRRLRRVEENAAGTHWPAAASFAVETSRAGSLDRLTLRERARIEPPSGAVEIEVRAAGLNFRDVLSAMGQYPGGPIALGSECAGVVARLGEGVLGLEVGDEVVALAPGCMGTFATTLAELVLPKPARLAFDVAAGVPIVFVTAAWALDHLARLSAGERVLIHAGAGGVGLAAVQLARRVGAEIFATAGSPEKRAYLASLGVEHVMDSRSLDFADEIAEVTGGEGVDVVLNSLPGDYIAKSLSALGPYGRFVEIGRTDIYRDTRIGLAPFRNNLSYFAVDLDRLSRERPALVRAQLESILADMESGALEPVRSLSFPVTDVVSGFRTMAQRKNTGKIVVSMEREVANAGDTTGTVRADGTYLVTGGTGALGLHVARWLAERGARHIALISRSGESDDVSSALESLRGEGVSVGVESADVADPVALGGALDRIRKSGPPLRGVVHAAGVLSDALLTDLDRPALDAVLAPKIDGAWHLHTSTSDDPLDFFVLFSSVAGVLGSPGQGNYAAGNAFLDALASWRRGQGRPAVSIAWGPWEGPGMAGSEAVVRALHASGIEPIAPADAATWLSRLVSGDDAQPVVLCVDWSRLIGRLDRGRVPPQLSEIAEGVERDGAHDDRERADVAAILALPESEQKAVLVDALQSRLAVIMGIDGGRVDPEEPLADLGLDSLMALELLDGVELGFGVVLEIEHVVEHPTLSGIADAILAHLTNQVDAAAGG